MRRWVVVMVVTFALVGGQLIYQANGHCAGWRDRYRNFMVESTLRQSPQYSEAKFEEAVGERPFSCPTPTLRDWTEDLARYEVPWDED